MRKTQTDSVLRGHVVPKGYESDGFSVPWWLSWIRFLIFLPHNIRDLFDPRGHFVEAAIHHDYRCEQIEHYYQTATETNNQAMLLRWHVARVEADYDFLLDLQFLGASKRKCKKFYAAVCVGTKAKLVQALGRMCF